MTDKEKALDYYFKELFSLDPKEIQKWAEFTVKNGGVLTLEQDAFRMMGLTEMMLVLGYITDAHSHGTDYDA